jgi:hypothetical protein
MKRLAFLSFTIATLFAPIQVQAQTTCVTFPQPPNPEAEVQEPARGEGQGVLPVLCAVLSRSSLISAEPRSAKIFKFAPLPLCPPIGQRKRLA